MRYTELIDQQIHSLKPYQAGLTKQKLIRDKGFLEVSKFASNESPIGLSNSIKSAVVADLENAHLYPDCQELTDAIAKYSSISAEQVILGNGSIDVIELAFRLVSRKGAHLLCSQHGYCAYPLLAKACGLRVATLPSLPYFGFDLDSFLTSLNENTAIIAIDSPSNMSGKTLKIEDLDQFFEKIPSHILLVLDQAYIEFTAIENSQKTIELLDKYSNLLITRTFSKAFGLAGFRVGYGLGAANLIQWLKRIQRPFPLAGVSAKAALQAINEPEHLASVVRLAEEGKNYLAREIKKLGLNIIVGEGNFLVMEAGKHAPAIYNFLLNRGLIVRPLYNYSRSDLLRISPVNETNNRRLIDILQCYLQTLET